MLSLGVLVERLILMSRFNKLSMFMSFSLKKEIRF